MRHTRLAVALAATLSVGLALAAGPAVAAAPSNDTVSGATVVSGLPFSDTLTIDDATTDAADASLNANCGAPATNGSVWYAYTPAVDQAVIADVSASSFSAGVIVATGSPLELVNCGPGAVVDFLTAGQTYYYMAFSDTSGVTTGQLSITFTAAPPPPTLELSVDPTAKVDRSGAALVTGTLTCTGDVDFTAIEVSLRQAVGRFAVTGYGWDGDLPCDGTVQPWLARVTGDNGTFAGGKAASFTFAFACGPVFCGDSYAERTIKLSRSGR